MGDKFINYTTTLLGLAIIVAAPISVFMHPDKIEWFDSIGGILAGAVLVFVKDKGFSDLLNKFLEKGRK